MITYKGIHMRLFNKKFWLGSLILLACVGAGVLSWHLTPDPNAPTDSVQIGGPFVLTDPTGQVRRSQDYQGKYLLVYFGYTFCPDICPMGLNNLTDGLQLLEKEGRQRLVDKCQPLFITLDPARDTPAALATFISQFHPKLVGLTGEEEALKEVAQAYKVYSSKFVPDPNHDDYLMDHSSIIYVIAPDGSYQGHFNHLTPPEEIATKLKAWVKA